MFAKMLRRLRRALSPRTRGGRRSYRQCGTCRPRVEPLETRLTPSGNLAFAFNLTATNGPPIVFKQWPVSAYVGAMGVAADAAGNVYTAGGFAGTVDFDPGPGVANLTYVSTTNPVGYPVGDIFVAKYTRAGALVWAHNVGGPGGYDRGGAITLDNSGNVYVTGTFTGTADFDPGPGTFNLTAPQGQTSNFVLKLDAGGNFLWASQNVGGPIAVDQAGNLYLSAWGQYVTKLDPAGHLLWTKPATFSGINVDASGDVYLTSSPGAVTKLDPAGNVLWARSITGGNYTLATGFTVDSVDNVYGAGVFSGTVDFDPGPGTFNLTSAGSRDAYFWKLDSGGNFVWARQFAAPNGSVNYVSLAVDGSGNIYSSGTFTGTVDFDPGPGTFDLTSTSSQGNAFVAKLDSGGNFVWARQFASASSGSIAVDPLGDIDVIGISFLTQLRDNNVYANPAWAGLSPGTDPDGAGPATAIGVDAFASAQAALDAAPDGGTVNLAPGAYSGGLTLTKSVHLLGGGSANTALLGQGAGIGLTITAPGVDIRGLTVHGFNGALYARGPSSLSLADVRMQGNTYGGYADGVPSLAFAGSAASDTFYVSPQALALDSDNPLFYSGVRSLTVDGGGGNDRLVAFLNDTGAAETVWLSAGVVSRTTATPFALYYRDTGGAFGQGVAVVLGDGNDVAVMQSQLAWTPTAVYGGAGADVFYVAASESSNYAWLTLDGGGGFNSWAVFDQSGGAVLNTLGAWYGAWVYQVLYPDGASSLLVCQSFDQYLGALPVM